MKKGLVSICMILMAMTIAYGQEVELSPKHQAKLDEIADKYERAIKFKKYYKQDSAKWAKQTKKEAKKLGKAIANENLDQLEGYQATKQILGAAQNMDSARVTKELKNQAGELTEKELNIDKPTIATDSASVLNAGKSLAKDKLSEEVGMDIPDIAIDSTTTHKIKDTAVNEGEKLIKDTKEFKELSALDNDSELGQLTEQKATIEKTQEELRQMAAQQEMKQKLTSKAKDFITENAEQISEVQSKMGDLKKKYSSVPNSNDLSTATKRKSLEGEPIWKRFFVGGNFNITKTEPFTMDISPMLGYRVNKLFDVGFTAIYRNQFSRKSTSVNEQEVYGYSVFANHLFYKNYFGYLEGEKLSSVASLDTSNRRTWKESLLLGVGRKFNITKWLEMQAIISVNLLHKNKDELYSSPVVFKTGIRFKP